MRSISLMLLALALLGGCVHSNVQMGVPQPPDGAPGVRALHDQLEAQQQALSSFQARGRLLVKLPSDPVVYVFRNARVLFEAPDRLHVDARKHGSRAFLLTVNGDGFVVVSPAKKTYFHETRDAWLAGTDGQVSPADLARELLLGADWTHLSARRMSLTGFDSVTGEVTLDVYESPGDARPSRRLLLRGGPPWQAVFEQRFDASTGQVVAETTRDDYVAGADTCYPKRIETHLSGRDAWMRLEIDDMDTAMAFDPKVFDVNSSLRDAQRRGYERMETLE